MEKTISRVKIDKRKKRFNILDLSFGIFSFAIIFANTSFSYNSFFIALLFLAFQRGVNSFLLSFCTSLGTSFILNVNYGLEILVITSVFLLLSLIGFAFQKNDVLKKYFSLIAINTILMGVYLLADFSFQQFLNSLISGLFSLVIVKAFLSLFDNIKNHYQTFTSINKIIVHSVIGYLLIAIHPFCLVLFLAYYMIMIQCNKYEVIILSLVIDCILLFYLSNYLLEEIIVLAIPLMGMALLKNKSRVICYLVLLILSWYLINPSFYLQVKFYLSLTPLGTCFILSEKNITSLKRIYSKEEDLIYHLNNQQFIKVNQQVEILNDYIDLVLNKTFESADKNFNKAKRMLENEVCSTCLNNKTCNLSSTKDKGIKQTLIKEDKNQILNYCLYPYKMLKRLDMAKKVYQLEESYLEEARIKKELFENQLLTLKEPLMKLKTTSFQHPLLLIESKVLKFSDFVKNVEYDDNIITFDSEMLSPTILTELSNNFSDLFEQTFIFKSEDVISRKDIYHYCFSSNNTCNIDLDYESRPHEFTNGDSLYLSNDNNLFSIYLSDGMGHNAFSKELSSYSLNVLSVLDKLKSDDGNKIETLNTLLKCKSMHEIFATLDYFKFNLVNRKYVLYKAGSFSTYLYHDKELSKLSLCSPPIGIISSLDLIKYEGQLDIGDILVFMSDGFIDEPYELLSQLFQLYGKCCANEIKTQILKNLLKQDCHNDDKTLVVLKITK